MRARAFALIAAFAVLSRPAPAGAEESAARRGSPAAPAPQATPAAGAPDPSPLAELSGLITGDPLAPAPLTIAKLDVPAAAAAAMGLGAADAPLERSTRIALLPPDNVSGSGIASAAMAALLARLEAALAREGLEVVSGAPVEAFLARHRLRITSGIDGEDASAASVELGVGGVLVTSVIQLDDRTPPRVALAVRLVSADADPSVYWMDIASRSGIDHRGLLDLGVVRDVGRLEDEVVRSLARSLARSLEGNGAGPGCGGGRRYRPQVAYRNVSLPDDATPTVAVLPFLNRTRRDDAGQVLALELTRQLAASGRFRVLEPGVVRSELVRRRVIVAGGISADNARMLLGGLSVDYLVAGTVETYQEAGGTSTDPVVEFGVTVLETRSGRAAWVSESRARGSDGVFLFDFGFVRNAAELTCRLMSEVSRGITGAEPTRPTARQLGARAAADRARRARAAAAAARKPQDPCLVTSPGPTAVGHAPCTLGGPRLSSMQPSSPARNQE